MAFQIVQNTDARYAIINNVGRDQYNIYKFESQLQMYGRLQRTFISNLHHTQQEKTF
jgi:hypothetical protein